MTSYDLFQISLMTIGLLYKIQQHQCTSQMFVEPLLLNFFVIYSYFLSPVDDEAFDNAYIIVLRLHFGLLSAIDSMMDNMSYPAMLTLMVPKHSKSLRHAYFTCFLVLYVIILTINIRLIMVIIMEKALHEPMYIFLGHLCVNGVYGASGFYPKILSDLITDSYVISSHMCALQTFVIYSSFLCEFTILTVMSYDRYVAICKPLEYHSRLTKAVCVKLILVSWAAPTFSAFTGTVLSSVRPFCTHHIEKLYCDNWSIVKLSCASSYVNNIYGYIVGILSFSFVLLIIFSYAKLIAACKVSSENRKKFWQTCFPHLFSLVNFFLAMLFDLMYGRYGANDLPESLRNFLALELVIVPPVLNPLIYGLNIRAVRKRVLPLCDSRRVHVATSSKKRKP